MFYWLSRVATTPSAAIGAAREAVALKRLGRSPDHFSERGDVSVDRCFLYTDMMSGSTLPPAKQIRMEKPADWSVWLSFVRIREEPELGEATDAAAITVAYQIYKGQMILYRSKLAKYNKQHDAFNTLILHIQSTISAAAAIFLEAEYAHPYNLLRALKLRLAPSNQARKIQIESEYHELCKGPANQDIEKWLDAWQQTYVTARHLGCTR